MKQESMKSLRKAMDILQLFLNTKREMALSEICDSLKLNKTTVGRIISVMVERGYISQKEKRGKYFLGTIYINFSGVVKGNLKLRQIAIPYLFELSKKVNETTFLSVVAGKNRILTESFYDSSLSNHTLRAIPDENIEVSAEIRHSTTVGKILLASYSEEELRQYFSAHRIKRRAEINNIRNLLLTIRAKGVAFDNEESLIGVRSVAAGVKNSEGKIIGSVGVVAPSVRLTRAEMKKLAPIVKSYAMRISNELGYPECQD